MSYSGKIEWGTSTKSFGGWLFGEDWMGDLHEVLWGLALFPKLERSTTLVRQKK